MRTLVISDLHIGGQFGADVLSREEPRAALLGALEGVHRLVLLGDVLELRHGPRRDALAAARPVFEALGKALAGREMVVVAGNHDHALVELWLRKNGELQEPVRLGVEQRFSAREASSMLATLAEWAAPAQLSAAYPGLWLREDVYATHGHYLDCHLTVPTVERLGIGVTGRLLRRPPTGFTSVEDYEAVSAPVFAWIDAIAREAPTRSALNGQSTVRIWRELGGQRANGTKASLRAGLLKGAFPVAVAALNRAGLGHYHADISAPELRRAGLRAMGEVAQRLGLGDAHVIFGHTHRLGPLAGDDVYEWVGPSGARLVNAGCWTYDASFLSDSPRQSPYWPGGSVLIEDYGPPVLRRLLDEHSHAQLVASRA
jgi:calcineurin-like phosphoesterase family protein